MKFAQPIWLAVILLMLPALVGAFYIFNEARLAALKRFASARLLSKLTANVSPRLRLTKQCLFGTGVLLCLLSLARPQFGFHWQESKRKGIDILFAVDTSRSMLAQDVNPDRLTRAKLAVLDLVAKLQGDRVGLIAFAGASFLQCPLTLDYDAFRQSLEALDSNIIPKGGTDVASAIQEAEKAFKLGNPSHKILVLITDGEDLESKGVSMAKEAAQHDVRIFTVGVGTTNGELIPLHTESGGVEFVKDEKGQTVKSRLDESVLRQIAEVTGGMYEPLGQRGQGLEAIYDRGLAPIPKQELSSRMTRIFFERFQWPLALGILCFVIEMLLGDRKSGSKREISNRSKSIALTGLLLLFALGTPVSVRASPQSAEKAYQHGKYREAMAQYRTATEKTPKQSELQFNFGASAYKNGQWTEAADAFQKALHTDQIPLQQQTFYNLGNTQYRLGQQTQKTNPQQTIQTWHQALQSYENAIKLKADDRDAKYNYDYVKKKLEELEKQQKENQDKKDSKDQKKEQNPKQKDDSNKKESKDSQSASSKERGESSQKQQDPKDSSAAPEKQAHEKDAASKAQSSQSPDHPTESPDQRESQPLPGQMTKDEAKNLLDSLKGDEKKMPVLMTQPGQNGREDDSLKRDW